LKACLESSKKVAPITTDYKSFLREVIDSSENKFIIYRQRAVDLTKKHFSNKRKLFNPLYISNTCVNDCLYCGYRISNKTYPRRTLTPEQSFKEAIFLISRGVKNIIVLAGEYSKDKYFDMIVNHIIAIKKSNPLWIGIEVAPLDAEQYRHLASIGADSVIVFQESYDRQIYAIVHGKKTPKSDYDFRYETPFRAVTGGIKEVGLGVLYGVGDWFEDTCNMMEHASKISQFDSEVKIRFSFPRLMESTCQERNVMREEVTEVILERIMVTARLLFPQARLVLTARESQKFRLDMLDVITDIGEAGSTIVGGYTIYKENDTYEQFKLPGINSLDNTLQKVRDKNFIIQ